MPSGNGFRIEHMPDFLLRGDFENSEPHVHSFYEIIWFQDGCGVHMVDFIDFEVKPNTLVFLSPGQIHNFDSNVRYKGISIKLCTDFMGDENGESSVFLKYNFFHTLDAAPYYSIDDDTAAMLRPLVDEMERESLLSNEFGNIDVLKSLLRIFLVKIQRHGTHSGEHHLDGLKPMHQLFIRFRRLVEEEYRVMHTVQEYADELNVAVRTLNKCVNECAGMSPLAFINDRVMLEARRLVRYSGMMIKEIAYALGYDDPSYFVKLFKRTTGYLPSDFRELDNVVHCRNAKG